MVAGSQPGSSRVLGGDRVFPFPVVEVCAWLRHLPLLWQRAGDWPALIALYLLAAATLLLPSLFGTHPNWAYNWEGYTAWRWETYWEGPAGPVVEIWAPTDGLMTDSGQGPLVGLPVAIGTMLAGVGLTAMRVPVSLLAAVAVPLLWLSGRRLLGTGPATLATLLLATSPVFLLYGRTATLVGVSLLPLLLSTLALVRVLDAEDDNWRWRREGLVGGSLLLGIYAYAPVRLLWPLVVGLLLVAAVCHTGRRGVLVRTMLFCTVIVPAAVMILERLTVPGSDPVSAAVSYFHARGEQLVAMSGDLTDAEQYVRVEEAAAGSGRDVALQLVKQNMVDLARLLLDRDTGPPPIDYWNERGRFWPWFLFPFAAIGALSTLQRWVRARRGQTALLVPFVLFLGLALPLLLTSRVHIGRLIPALPFALLLVGCGAWVVAGWLAQLARSLEPGNLRAERWIPAIVAGAIVVAAALGTRFDMETPVFPTRESLAAATLAHWQADANERGGAVLVEDPALGDDIERVHAATYRLDLDRLYRFVDLQQLDELREVENGLDPRPALQWRGALKALQAGDISRPCERLWFVAPEISQSFFDAWQAAGCAGAPDSVILP